mgnify:CR=1 FL=1
MKTFIITIGLLSPMPPYSDFCYYLKFLQSLVIVVFLEERAQGGGSAGGRERREGTERRESNY